MIVIGACAHRTPSVRAPLSAPYVMRTIRADTIVRSSTEPHAAQLFGFPLLNTVKLPPHAREIRLSSWYSMFAGTPTPILRVVEATDRVDGEMWFVWVETRESLRVTEPALCGPWRGPARTCGVKGSNDSANWRVIADSLEQLGAWTLSSRCETNFSFITDSDDLNISRLRGDSVSFYSCNAPSHRRDSDVGRAALALSQYFASLARQMAPTRKQ